MPIKLQNQTDCVVWHRWLNSINCRRTVKVTTCTTLRKISPTP